MRNDDGRWHGSYEEQQALVHSSVNSFWEHNINDPSLTQEEAIQVTGQYAEKELTVLEEFQQAEAQQLEQNGGEVSSPDVGDNGLDAGDAGSMDTSNDFGIE